ncbi:hypothetical protein ACFFQF_28910 [Haladaptatus pallidirubidus]|nr:hypothetical protein [Haladaptatus pallidirubidus]
MNHIVSVEQRTIEQERFLVPDGSDQRNLAAEDALVDNLLGQLYRCA